MLFAGNNSMKGFWSRRFAAFSSGCLALLILQLPACQRGGEKHMAETMQEVIDGLKPRTEYMVFGRENGPSMLITPALGARVTAASVNGLQGRNLLWANPEIFADKFWKDGPGWNAGGFRSWIAPEDAFYLDEKNNWFVPPAMDPGNYKLINSTSVMATFANEFALSNRQGQEYKCRLTREIHLLESYQWQQLSSIPEGIEYVGIRVIHSLENMGTQIIGDKIPYVGLWSLLMVEPSGTMIIPLTKPGGKGEAYRDYFNPLPPERISVSEKAITVKIDGKYRSKIGISPEYAGTAIAFLAEDAIGKGRLYIKQFMVDPNGVYLDHPWGQPSEFGDVIEMYNDDGKMGGFAELECHGPSQKLKPGDKESHDVYLHILTGPVEVLKKTASAILELDLSALTFYK